jgi:hypothetical protein
MVKRIYIRAAVLLLVAALISAIWGWNGWPLGIATGGLLGIVNLKAMVWGIKGMLGVYRASSVLVLFSIMRLFILLAIIGWLLKHGIVNMPGVLIGFTIVFIVVMKEGLVQAGEEN